MSCMQERPAPAFPNDIRFAPGPNSTIEDSGCASPRFLIDFSNATVGGTSQSLSTGFPFMSINFVARSDITAVLITARTDDASRMGDSQGLQVYLGFNSPREDGTFSSGQGEVQCSSSSRVNATQLGQVLRFNCPAHPNTRYVTVLRNVKASQIFLAEITPVVTGAHVGSTLPTSHGSQPIVPGLRMEMCLRRAYGSSIWTYRA